MSKIAMEEYELMKDSKYRMYVAGVEKALKNFEYTSEWPDLISALGKLNKVILNYTKFPVIPRRIKISKRLAQCMHPALPSGVHLKALETYDVIFKCMGTNRLAQELFIYSAGLFPLLGHSAMNVRPSLLKVYETHFVPLGERLRPALSGFLSGVLPGLESGSDHFDRTNALLEKVCDGVGQAWFYTCIWQCVRSNGPVRLPAIGYVLQHFNKKVTMEDQLYMMGNDIDVMVSGLCAAVQDSSVLVQRSALDLLLVGFPMHNTQLLYSDMVRLVTASLTTILRRDMSLNRRLYSWLLGTEINISTLPSDHPLVKHMNSTENKSHTDKYFALFSFDILVESIRTILSQASSKNNIDIKPYRLLTSLLDKPQIGPVILDTILYDVFRALYLTCLMQKNLVNNNNNNFGQNGRSVSFDGDISSLKFEKNLIVSKDFLSQYCMELTKNANLLFNTLEAYYIWNYLGKIYENAVLNNKENNPEKIYHVNEIGSGKPNILEICTLTEFLLDVIPIETYIDTTSEILPNLFQNIIKIMEQNLKIMNKNQITQSLELSSKILNKIQPVVNIQKNSDVNSPSRDYNFISDFPKLASKDTEHIKTPTENGEKVVSFNIENFQNAEILLGNPNLIAGHSKSTSKIDNIKVPNENSDKMVSFVLEKSKSDSKINENLSKSSDSKNLGSEIDNLGADINRDRSNSNQFNKNKKNSPKIDKKSKNKKSKSSSKLYDLKKDVEGSIEILDKGTESFVTQPKPQNIQICVKTENKHILACLKVYKNFYVKFILVKILNQHVDVDKSFEKLLAPEEEEGRTKDLEILLNNCLDKNNSDKFFPNFFPDKILDTQNSNIRINYFNFSDSYIMAMKLASNILLDFNSFPDVLEKHADEKLIDKIHDNENINDKDNTRIPFWLKTLIICACTNQKSSPEIQMIAMNALLEILSLAKSQNFGKWNGSNTTENNNEVVIMGILEGHSVNYIENSTHVLEVVSQILWDFLGNFQNQNHILTCITLLYQIHNIFESKNFCEQVIAKYLISENLRVEYFKRFTMVWHLGRDLDLKIPVKKNRTMRNFDRSLLKIYDNLENTENVNLKLLSETFLVHSLLRNDITRLINPLLMILLAPKTSRISITHVHIQKNEKQADVNNDSNDKKNNDDIMMNKIRAISSVNGNVVYHVSEKNSNVVKPAKLKSFLFSKAGKKTVGAIDMTASMTENANIVSKKNSDFVKNLESPNYEQILSTKNNITLFINPLSSKEIYPNGVMGNYTSSKFDSISDNQSSSDSLSSLNEISTSLLLANKSDADIEISKCNNDIQNKSNTKSLTPAFASKLLEQIEPITDGFPHFVENFVEKFSPDENISNNKKIFKSHSLEEKSNLGEADVGDKNFENNSLVHSWSYSISDSEKIDTDLEISTAADEFFTDPIHMVTDILDEILEGIFTKQKKSKNHKKEKIEKSQKDNSLKAKIEDKPFSIFPMHHHILLYCDVFDSNIILYALKIFKNIILTNPRLFITCLATNGLHNNTNTDMLNLLAKHRKSVFGFGFSGEPQNEYLNFYRGFMFLEILISVCLNYARSYYPNLDNPHLSDLEIQNNLKIHLASLDLLDLIIKNLISLVNENAKGFSSYIGDLLSKCKLQKILLHCLLTSVNNFDSDNIMTFAEEILTFNKFQLYDEKKKISEHMESYQIQLLRLIQSLIILEHNVFSQQENVTNSQSANLSENIDSLKYTPTVLIPQQGMFLSAILGALRDPNLKNLHQNWCNMITFCLPYMGHNLNQISLSVVHQICNNIEKISENFNNKNFDILGDPTPDYAITQLEALTIICHYCLLDSNQNSNQISLGATPYKNPTNQIFNNLLNVFLPPITFFDSQIFLKNTQNTDFYFGARKNILSHMPRIIASVSKLWKVICQSSEDFNSIFCFSKVVKQQILEFLSPISLHHSANFLAAVAVAWYDRRNTILNQKKVLPEPNLNQKNLVYLISAIRVIPIDNLVQTVHAVIKSPPATVGHSVDLCLDVAILELFYCYMQNATGLQLVEAWASLLGLFRESITFSPLAQFLLMAILHELMLKCCPLPDRKDHKDLQDVTAKLIESISTVCGSCLEQTTWLRRNLAVKEDVAESDTASVSSKSGSFTENTLMQVYSVQAQLVLAEILAPVLDICFGSQEKDKITTILTSLMYNIVPYLKTHTLRNMASFHACSKLLASLSSYPYTRKAWRKDVFDLLLDNNLFQMEQNSLKYWKIIIDNLMTHDNTTFRDLMSRVSMTQSGSLSLFSSREQEYEQRAQLLKRLAFVILCSEMDQYSKYMPDIQEQLASSLRLCVPGVQAQVFLCFRVILLRMSPIHVTSLWPTIISEMLQVFLQIEQELSTDTEEFSSHIKLLSTLDASWSMNSNNGLNAQGHPHFLHLQLATTKLLDLALILPATALPQFQMYRWAFVGEDLTGSSSPKTNTTFVPHVTRIANLMDRKFPDNQIETLPTKQNELLLTINQLARLRDLHSFFKTLSLCSIRHRTDCCNISTNLSHGGHTDRQQTHDKKLTALLEKLDKQIEIDFLDKISR